MAPTTTRFVPAPLKRFREHLREIRRVVGETRALVSAAHAAAAAERATLAAEIEGLSLQIDALGAELRAKHQQLAEIARFVHDRGHWRRERLRQLRADPDYECAFSDPQPLVSVVIPTADNHVLLRNRSIPSVLAQSYQNFEIVVVGDAAPDEAKVAVESFGDPRLSFFNLPYRGPYPDEPEAAWMVSGVPPANEAIDRARGMWIAPLDDDDAFRPRHLEQLLESARRDHLEVAYARQAAHLADGQQGIIGCFPPQLGQFGLAAVYHAGLSDIFEFELADAAFGLPADWAFCLRMMEAGVRIGMLDEVTVDTYPSRSWTERWEGDRFAPAFEPESAKDAGDALTVLTDGAEDQSVALAPTEEARDQASEPLPISAQPRSTSPASRA